MNASCIRWIKRLAALLTLAIVSTGCVVYEHEHVHGGRAYYGRGYYGPQHIHCPGCGHTLRGGVWVTVP
jgi:hypothetical protein